MSISSRVALALLLVLPLGCVTRTSTMEQAPAGDTVGATLVVERFLQAVNANDIQTMSRLFGTKQGPIAERDPQDAVEQRMFALASLLRHEDYSVTRERVVPGRIGEAVQIVTRVRLPRRTSSVEVPFTVVRAGGERWLVEQIGVEELGRR